jgi:hypothetical protein
VHPTDQLAVDDVGDELTVRSDVAKGVSFSPVGLNARWGGS